VRPPAHDRLWQEVSFDASAIEKGETRMEIACRTLWSTTIPKDIAQKWSNLKQHLLETDSEIWRDRVDWYDARLRGELIETDIHRAERLFEHQ